LTTQVRCDLASRMALGDSLAIGATIRGTTSQMQQMRTKPASRSISLWGI